MAGLSRQGELNIDVLDQNAASKLAKWFDNRWNASKCIICCHFHRNPSFLARSFMHKCRYIFSGFLGFILCLMQVGQISCARNGRPASPQAVDGILDLSEWDFSRNGSAALNGMWEFYPYRNVTPETADVASAFPDLFARVPSPWKKYGIADSSGRAFGYATYRLKVVLPRKGPDAESGHSGLILKISGAQSAYRCWVDDRLMGGMGEPGEHGEGFRGLIRPAYIALGNPVDTLRIALFVANYFDPRWGGISEPLILGAPSSILLDFWRNSWIGIGGFAVFIIIGIYHLWLWTLRRKDWLNIHFALICLVMALQAACTGERFFYAVFPDMSIETFYRVWYLVFTLFPLILVFYRELFPMEIHRTVVRLVAGIFAVCIALDLTLPVRLFMSFSVLFYWVGILVVIYIIFRNIVALKRKREFAGIVLAGAAVPMIAAIHDSIFAMGLISSIYLTPVAFMVYILSQTYVISLKFTKLYKRNEELNRELESLNRELERKVEERTDLLFAANQKLLEANEKLGYMANYDVLTELANRRFFMDFLAREWKRAERHRESVSIIMLDIDFFKRYNDTYGHPAGDGVLKRVAECISASLQRSSDVAARYGGEEFVIYLADTNLPGALTIAERIRRMVYRAGIEHQSSIAAKILTVSLGVASAIPAPGSDPADLLQAADTMLYQSKKMGRNRVSPEL